METLEEYIKNSSVKVILVTYLKTELDGDGFELLLSNGKDLRKLFLFSETPLQISKVSNQDIYLDPITEIKLKAHYGDQGVLSSYWLYIRSTTSSMVLSIRPQTQTPLFTVELIEI